MEPPISRLVLGTFALTTDGLDRDAKVLDEYVRLGGRTIDTAAVYGGGDAEIALGEWLAARASLRDSLVVISKGAHPDGARRRVTEADIASDVAQSVERLGGPVDVYLLHRDDPSVPVGEIVGWMNAHLEAGSVRAIGTSNWTTARIDEANAYAAAHGLPGFSVSSQHLSLATQNEEHWPDTRSATVPDIAEWHARTQTPLLAWSAQARGYFAGRSDAEVLRVYDNPVNRERRERASAVGARLGVGAQQVALAWVLHQPYPVHAAFGARSVEQVRSAWAALEIDVADLAGLASPTPGL
jgi:aryl-alcohol dehydrogenase-like predicted oxidoreductase